MSADRTERVTPTVSEAMSSEVPLLSAGATLQDASAAMLDAGTHTALIADRGKLLGILRAEHVAAAMARGADVRTQRVDDVCDRDVVVTHPDEALPEAHGRMRSERSAGAAVIDGAGHPIGVLLLAEDEDI